MPTLKALVNEVIELTDAGSPYDVIWRRYLQKLHEHTKRNVIAYYSGWLQKPRILEAGFISVFSINDNDKNGFMACIHEMDRSLGLDVLLHTPGGEISATESLVDYLRAMFGANIRAIIPQLSMSAGTMIACACESIVMGKQSSLGPIDPQLGGIAAHGVVEEFKKAREEILADSRTIPLWQPIISQYEPTFIGECQRAMELSREMVFEWLKTGMFKDDPSANNKANRAVQMLSDHSTTKTHDRHLSIKKIQDIGLAVTTLEENQEFQDLVLSVHHACILSLTDTSACKIIQNHSGAANIIRINAG